MNRRRLTRLASGSSYAGTAWLLLIVLLVVAGSRAPYLFTNSGIAGVLVTSTPLVLIAMALTATALVGSGVDLSVGPLMILVNVLLVRVLFDRGIETPWVVVAVALAIGVAVEVVEAVVITILRIEAVIVTLSGFLAISGVNLVILDKPQGEAPDWLAQWGSGTSVISPMSLTILIAVAAWIAISRTPFFSNIRLVGYDPRTAFVSGIPVVLTRIGAHVISGVLVGLAGLAYTGMIASGNPKQGDTYTLAAVTAFVLGGASLSGGRGGILGSIPGALAVTMISFTLTTFSLGARSGFVTQLTYGLILVGALTIGAVAPRILRTRKAAAS